MPSLSPRIDQIQSYNNLLLNSGLDHWQRTTSTTVTSGQTYVADRWSNRGGGGGQNYTISRDTFVPTNAFCKYSQRIVRNGGSNITMTQALEATDIRPYIGKTLTFSCWAYWTGGTIGVALYTPASATEDAWTSNIILNDTLVSSATVGTGATLNQWVKLSYTFVVPVAAVNGLAVSWQPSGHAASENIYITACMLTEGTSVPEYFYRQGRSVADDFQRCLRYCWVDGAFDAGNGVQHIFAVGKAYASTNGTTYRDFPVHMRIAPTASLTEAFSSYQMINAIDSSNPVATGVSFTFISVRGLTIIPTVASGLTAGDGTFFTRANGNTTAKIIYTAEL